MFCTGFAVIDSVYMRRLAIRCAIRGAWGLYAVKAQRCSARSLGLEKATVQTDPENPTAQLAREATK